MSAGRARLSAPELLRYDHDLEQFQCGIASLDDWLKRRARANQAGGASRTYVIAAGKRVIGYYCLSSGAIAAIDAPGNIRRNMPDPFPMTVMGRLAIDHFWQGKRIGVALLQDAVLRAAQAAEIIGIRGILVHAISTEAMTFYEHHGFVSSRSNPMTLFLSLKGVVAA
ncbi:MAG: GNAT family N-acetyltransferase [Sphingomonas sp.]